MLAEAMANAKVSIHCVSASCNDPFLSSHALWNSVVNVKGYFNYNSMYIKLFLYRII